MRTLNDRERAAAENAQAVLTAAPAIRPPRSEQQIYESARGTYHERFEREIELRVSREQRGRGEARRELRKVLKHRVCSAEC